jgi:hypothetical protein
MSKLVIKEKNGSPVNPVDPFLIVSGYPFS